MSKCAWLLSLICLTATVLADCVAVVSPDGKNEIRLETEPTLAFQVFRNGRALTERSPMAMMVEGKAKMGGAGLKIVSKAAANRTGTIASPIYKKASVDETAKGMVVSFGEWSVELIARNDGVAWRYVTDFGDKEVIVKNERIDLKFASGEQTVYATPNYGHGADDPLQNSWEGIYTKRQVKDAPQDPKSAENGLWYAPITFIYPSGETMVVEESDIWDYPGWNFNGTADGRTLTSLFAAYPKKTVYENWGADSRSDKPLRYQRVLEREDYLARTRGTRTYPWRVFALADNVAKIAESDIVFALASPNAIGDASWVKPGKVAWDWWNNWNLTGVDFRAGINTRTYEYYIDFAAKNGIEYVIFDEGWSQHLDVEKYNPDMDVPHLVRYANERGVGIILWAAWAQFHGRAERVVSKYAQMGVKGFKVDFMDRDDQLCYEFLRDFAALCAKYKMVVDYHGMSKPAGFARTYPNVLCFEGVQGLENLKGKTREFFPAMDCTIAFTRMAAGPLDYTPGAMRNFCKGTYHPHPNTPGSYGTRVHQMALMVIYEAPLEMLCDSPTQYLANRECFDFMRKLPVVWDETIALEGEMDACATIARRKGADWYVGSICGWEGHATEIDTSFLGSGEWTADVFADGVNADRDAVDYAHRTMIVHAGEKIPVKLMPGGGWTARFTPLRKKNTVVDTAGNWNRSAREKFAEQRFGIFVHWGLYANYAQGEWYLQKGRLDERAYSRMKDGFCPSRFDAREWARVFRNAGARYVTITARHHDGFSLWPTKADDGYNIANTPFGRDVLGELAAACEAEGLQLNFYYSLMDWHRKDYPAGWASSVVLGKQKGDYASYKKFMMSQIEELIDAYHPGSIWFDGEWDHTSNGSNGDWNRTLDWDFDSIYDLIHSGHVLVANNNHQPIREKEDIQLFERDLPGENATGFSPNQKVALDRPIEQCDVIQHDVWGYKIGESKFRTASEVIAMLARAAAKDSNLLMNIGPDGSGRLPEQAVAVLADVGKWMEKNGESVYGTSSGGVGLLKDVVSTRRDNVLYLHFLNPNVRTFTFRLNGEIDKAEYLASGDAVSVKRTDTGDVVITINRPEGFEFDIVVKVVTK